MKLTWERHGGRLVGYGGSTALFSIWVNGFGVYRVRCVLPGVYECSGYTTEFDAISKCRAVYSAWLRDTLGG